MQKPVLGRREIIRAGIAYSVAGSATLVLSQAVKATETCGGFPRSEFERYVGLFSENDTDAYGTYYTDDVVFERGPQTLRGPAEVLAFYRTVHEHLSQKLTVVNYAATDRFIGAEVHSEFTVFKHFKDESAGLDLKAGTHFIGYNFVHYDLRDGKMAHIRSAPFKRLA